MSSDDFTGPVSYAAFVFPAGSDPSAAAAELLRTVERGVIEILDLEVLGAGADGRMVSTPIADHPELAAFQGAGSGLLDEEDLEAVAAEVGAGDRVVVIVYEDRALAPVAGEVLAAGGRELWTGGVSIEDLEISVVEHMEEN